MHDSWFIFFFKQSVYNNRWAGYLGGQMHEVGHNLGLRHAYENGDEYSGRIGYMGTFLAPKNGILKPEKLASESNSDAARSSS